MGELGKDGCEKSVRIVRWKKEVRKRENWRLVKLQETDELECVPTYHSK